jgi:predicted RNA-binding protein with PUA-like domain
LRTSASPATTVRHKTIATKAQRRSGRDPGTRAGAQAAPRVASAQPWAMRAPGERRYWLVKSEPAVFSFQDLQAAPGQTTSWDGVRNYQARNYMRDGMRIGDLVLFYHSNAEPAGVAGIAEVVREAHPDITAFDASHDHHDPSSDPSSPTWVMVDLRAVEPLPSFVPLDVLRGDRVLAGLETIRRGSRLSVHPVSATHFARVRQLGGLHD